MKKVSIEFSGWCDLPLDEVNFISCSSSKVISGEEYFNLSEFDQEDYVLENVVDCISKSTDGSWEQIDFDIVEE